MLVRLVVVMLKLIIKSLVPRSISRKENRSFRLCSNHHSRGTIIQINNNKNNYNEKRKNKNNKLILNNNSNNKMTTKHQTNTSKHTITTPLN